MSKTVAETILAVFEEAGAKRCYGLPGDTLNYFTEALRRGPIRFIHVRHEEAAGFAAGADAMLTGELALCAGSCGPGSLHFINGLFDAQRSRNPVVLIASQVVRDELGFDFPQEVDFKAVYHSLTVFCEEVRTPASARRMAAVAAQAALARRGVAVLIVPADVAKATAPDQPAYAVHRARPIVQPNQDELEALVVRIEQGSRIAIYGGSGCEHAHDEVVALADRLKAPVAWTSRAKDFLEHDNPFGVGMTGVFGVASGYEALMQCDTLLLLGCDFAWRQFYPDKATIIQIDIDGTHLGRRHPVDLALVGDVPDTLAALTPRLRAREDRGFVDNMLGRRVNAETKLERHSVAAPGPIHPQYATQVMAQLAKPDAIWTADTGTPTVWLLRHVPGNGRNRTILSLTHGTMANAMPQALGAAAACPDRQVIALCGDGGLAMLLGDLLTAVQEKLPIKIAVFNNGSLGFVEQEQKAEGLLDSYTTLDNPDFGRVAEAIGFWGRRVEVADELNAAVEAWLAAPGPALLDIVVDRFELVMPAHLEPAQVFGTALYSVKAILHGKAKDAVSMIGNVLT